MKKVLSLLMVLCLVVGMVPVAASADETFAEQINNALNNSSVNMSGDTSISMFPSITEDKTIVIDLGGKTLSLEQTGTTIFSGGANVTIQNGYISANAIPDGTSPLFKVETGSSLTINNVTIDTTGAALFPCGDAASLTVKQSRITGGAYAVGTNAATTNNYNVVITLSNSEFHTKGYLQDTEANKNDGCAVMINVAGTLNVDECVIEGSRQGMIVRAGKATISNSNISTTGMYPNKELYYTSKWGSGTEVPAAALTVGNYCQDAANAYLADASVTLESTTVIADKEFPAIYIDGNTSYKTSVSISGPANIKGDVLFGQQTQNEQMNLSIYSGDFTADVSDYVAPGSTIQQVDGWYIVEKLNESNAEAQVDEEYYATVEEALENAPNGSIIKLLKQAVSGELKIKKDITFDLNNLWISVDNEDGYAFSIEGDYDVIFTNGVLNASPLTEGDYTPNGTKALGLITDGSLTFDGCTIFTNDGLLVKGGTVEFKNASTIEADNTDAMAIQINDGTVTIGENCVVAAQKHGTAATDRGIGVFIRGTDENANPVLNVHGTISSYGSAIQGNGTDRSNPTINICEGANVVSDKLAVYLPQPGTVNITGAKVAGYAGIGIKSGTLNIKDSEIHGVAPDDILEDKHSTTGGINTDGSAIVIDSYVAYAGEMNITISGDSEIISDHSTAIREIGNDDSATNIVTLKIEEGYFSSAEDHLDIMVRDVTKETVEISGGYFTSDPSEYVAAGMAAVESDKEEYAYMVAEAGENPAEVVPADPSVTSDLSVSGEDETLLESITSSLGATGEDSTPPSLDADSLNAAALTEANSNTTKVDNDLVDDLKKAIGGNVEIETNDVTIVIQPYMDIKVTDVNSDGNQKSFTLDITPMYRKVAVKNDNGSVPDDIITDTDAEGETGSSINAVVVEKPQQLKVNQPTEVVIPLPANFTTKNTLYVLHDNRHYHRGTVASKVLTFTTEGFSPFTISTNAVMAAQIGDVYYDSLQDAVDNVKNGETVVLLKDGESATVSRDVNFSVDSTDGNSFTATISAGTGYRNVGSGNSYDFEKNPSTPVNPNPGGDDDDKPEQPEVPAFPFTDVKSTAWYYNAVKYVYENNLMAGTGDTTFDPEVSLTRAMTAQILYNLESQPKVDEEATFADMTEAPTWSVDAIAWAQDTGVVAGMGDNEFAPNAKVTREQFAQMMYNYAKYKKYDLTKTGDLSKFPDDGSVSDWAETAMSWANGNGLINGHEDSGLIDPAGNTIRGQAASILMNFDKNVVK